MMQNSTCLGFELSQRRIKMKVSYMLLNRSELGNGVPSGMAWQWIHCIEDEKQLVSILNKVKKIITKNWLTFANFQVDKQHEADKFLEVAHEIISSQIYYDEKITPERIFYINEDLRYEDDDDNQC
jgi:hypothetical protein